MVSRAAAFRTIDDSGFFCRVLYGTPADVEQPVPFFRKRPDRMELVELGELARVGVVLQCVAHCCWPNDAPQQCLVKVPVLARLGIEESRTQVGEFGPVEGVLGAPHSGHHVP